MRQDGRAIVPGMAAPQKTTDDRDVISQLADKGEDALRQLVDRPRRMVDGAIHGLDDLLRDMAARLRAIDPLERRVAAIEKRLDAIEKPARATARRSPGRAKPSTAAAPPTAVATEPGNPTTIRSPRAATSLASANAMRPRRAANTSPPGSRTRAECYRRQAPHHMTRSAILALTRTERNALFPALHHRRRGPDPMVMNTATGVGYPGQASRVRARARERETPDQAPPSPDQAPPRSSCGGGWVPIIRRCLACAREECVGVRDERLPATRPRRGGQMCGGWVPSGGTYSRSGSSA